MSGTIGTQNTTKNRLVCSSLNTRDTCDSSEVTFLRGGRVVQFWTFKEELIRERTLIRINTVVIIHNIAQFKKWSQITL